MEETFSERGKSAAATVIFILVFCFHFASKYLDSFKKKRGSMSEVDAQLRAEINQLLQEANSLSQPSTFAQSAKLRRMAAAKEKELAKSSTDHRGTSEFPGRTVTLEPAKGKVCWGVAYKIIHKEDQEAALEHLEVREKQYDKKVYVNFYTESSASTPAVSNVMVYIASADKKLNKNYLGPSSVEEIAVQILEAEGPSGPNRDYLFKLENALIQIGVEPMWRGLGRAVAPSSENFFELYVYFFQDVKTTM